MDFLLSLYLNNKMARLRTYRKAKDSDPTASSDKVRNQSHPSPQQPPPRTNRAFIELEARQQPPKSTIAVQPPSDTSQLPERVGPPRRKKKLRVPVVPATPAILSRTPSPSSPHASSPLSPRASPPLPPRASPPSRPHVSSPSSPSLPHALSSRGSVSYHATTADPSDNNDLQEEDSNLKGPPLFWPDEDEIDELYEEDEGSVDLEQEAAEEDMFASMMTGGRFTHDQISEIRNLTKSLMDSLRRRAKAWNRPLGSLMRVSNLVITTKERRAGGNVWNAYQSSFPEDPEKETRTYHFFYSFSYLA